MEIYSHVLSFGDTLFASISNWKTQLKGETQKVCFTSRKFKF